MVIDSLVDAPPPPPRVRNRRAGAAGRRLAAGCLLALAAAWGGAAAAGPLSPGNVVVYRVGDGAASLVATGNAVFLDEFAPNGTLVQSIALPTVGSGAQKALVASGTATTDGLLTRSTNRNCLVVPGYGRDLGTGTGNLATSGTVAGGGAIPRVVGRVTAAGVVDTSTALTDFALQSNFRGATSTDCTNLWTTGVAAAANTSQGVHYSTLGATTSSDVTSATLSNVRALGIFGGQLYASAAGTGSRGISAIGSGLPTTASAVARLPGLSDTNSPSNYAFFLADLSADVPGPDTLYVADDTNGAGGGIGKFSLVAGTWVSNGTAGTAADSYRGLAASVTGTTVTLYATRKGGSTGTGGGELVKLVDTSGYNGALAGTPALLATAAANTAFRGVALAPEITVTPSAGPHGSISQGSPQVAAGGATLNFTVTPEPGYTALVGGSCGGTLNGTTYTTQPLVTDCTVDATFTQAVTYTLTPSTVGNGSISPATPQTVLAGATQSFVVSPGAGQSVTMGGTCGGTLAGTTYTTQAATADCTVEARFDPITYTVTPSAGAHGSISPAAAQTVNALSTATFTVAPDPGYAASVGGSCGGSLAGTLYTTAAIGADCTVQASFSPLPAYTVSVSSRGHGSVAPGSSVSVLSGGTATLTVTPDAGYRAAVRGSCGGALTGTSYVTRAVTADCSVAVTFSRKLVLFQGNSYTFGRVDPVMSYNTANVTDLTAAMWLADATGSNADEPHPWGGIPGVFKKLTDQMGLDYDVSISARNAASLRGHYLNSNPANWDLRGNLASQKWDVVVLQDLSDEPMPAGKSSNANLPYFRAYADKIEKWLHVGDAETFTETQLFGNGSAATCTAVTGASASACNTVRTTGTGNGNASASTDIYLYSTWARPDMIGPNGTNPAAGGTYYSAAEGLEAMTRDLHDGYYGEFQSNGRFKAVNPVGDAFLRAVTEGYAMRNPYQPEAGKLNLWHTDYFHPSKYGSYLSALVHFAMITGLDPKLLGPAEQAAADLGIAPADAVNLQGVARRAVLPAAPAIGQVLAGDGRLTVSFSAPANIGGLALGSYAVQCGTQGATGSSSPITVTGLSNGVPVACTVTAANSVGAGAASAASAPATPVAPVSAACGSASSLATAFAPAAGLCTVGSASSVVPDATAWRWSCTAQADTAQCSAPYQGTGTQTGTGRALVSGDTWAVDPARSAGFIRATGDAKSPPTLPPGLGFPYGLFDVTLTGGTAGSTATVVLTFSSALPAGTQYWKYGKTSPQDTPHWYVFPGARIAGNTVTLTLTDGGAGDDDGTQDAVITDPGGPAVALAASATAIPSLSREGLAVLALLLALAGFGPLRRRAGGRG